MLQIKGLNTYYGESHILRDVDMNINQGEMICLIGRNGVGKTTLLKSLIGLLTPRRGEIIFNGDLVNRKRPHQRARSGIGYVPQGREKFSALTVEQNILLPIYSRKNLKLNIQAKLQEIYNLFPILKEKKDANGSSLSGGQQQQHRNILEGKRDWSKKEKKRSAKMVFRILSHI